jgi:tripartite-type tricarboxylate transporter receptor subunit TctC
LQENIMNRFIFIRFTGASPLANLLAMFLVGSLLFASVSTFAQDEPWPARSLRIIVPGGAGGVPDIRARWLAQRLTPALGQSVVVENKAGAGGNIGTELGARSAPDGYTLVIIHSGTMTVNPHLYARTGYDALKDFAPLTRIGGAGTLVLAVATDHPAKSVADLVRMAKDKPGQLSFGSPGIGTPPHMAGELFKRLASIDAVHVTYKGGGQAANDLLAGHVTWTFDGANVQQPLVKSGRIRALAVSSRTRIPSLPDVPTLDEAGISGYEFTAWVGIALPAGTPRSIVSKLHGEISKILSSAEAKEYFTGLSLSAGADTPEAFAALIRADYEKWGQIVKQAGLKAE